MGDRSNIFVVHGREDLSGLAVGVGIYSHWHGVELHRAAMAAMPKAMVRQGDPSYFTRILFQNVLDAIADPNRETGFGIWVTGPDDNEHPILVIDAMTSEHWWATESTYRLAPAVVK